MLSMKLFSGEVRIYIKTLAKIYKIKLNAEEKQFLSSFYIPRAIRMKIISKFENFDIKNSSFILSKTITQFHNQWKFKKEIREDLNNISIGWFLEYD